MMTDEFKRALYKMSDEQFERFSIDLATFKVVRFAKATRDEHVYYFVQHPEQDRELCYVLNEKHGFNLKTEEEKNTWAAQVRAVSARCALGISLFALGIAALSLAFSVGLLSID